MILLLAFVWLLCAFFASGIFFAHVQEEWPNIAKEERRDDLARAIGLALFGGPIALFVAIFTTGFARHGMRWWTR